MWMAAVNCQLYTGKAKISSGHRLSLDVVTSLIQKSYLGSRYIYMDNYYTSPLLFRHQAAGFGACGTKWVCVLTTHENALSIRWIRDILYVKWTDIKVAMCSTVHSVDQWEIFQMAPKWRFLSPGPPITKYNTQIFQTKWRQLQSAEKQWGGPLLCFNT